MVTDDYSLSNSTEGWAKQRNGCWFYPTLRQVSTDERGTFWGITPDDNSLRFDTYFLSNTKWNPTNEKPPRRIRYNGQFAACFGVSQNGQVYTTWVQPVVLHLKTGDLSYINCIELWSDDNDSDGRSLIRNWAPGVVPSDAYNYQGWSKELISKFSDKTNPHIAYWLQNIPKLYQYNSFYFIVPINCKLRIGLKAKDYTSYIGGVVGDTINSSSAIATWWNAANILSTTWGGQYYVPIKTRDTSNKFQVDATPIYTDSTTGIETYIDLFKKNNIPVVGDASRPTTDLPYESNWFYGLRSPYGGYGFRRSSEDSSRIGDKWNETTGTTKICNYSYAVNGMLSANDTRLVRLAWKDDTVHLLADSSNTAQDSNFADEFYAELEKPISLECHLPDPPRAFASDLTNTGRKWTTAQGWTTSTAYVWGVDGTHAKYGWPDLLLDLNNTSITQPTRYAAGEYRITYSNPHDFDIGWEWHRSATKIDGTKRDELIDSGTFRAGITYDLSLSLPYISNADEKQYFSYYLRLTWMHNSINWFSYNSQQNHYTYTITMKLGRRRHGYYYTRQLLPDGSFSDWKGTYVENTESGTYTETASLHYGDQIKCSFYCTSTYYDNAAGEQKTWEQSLTVTKDQTLITLDSAPYCNLSVYYNPNYDTIDWVSSKEDGSGTRYSRISSSGNYYDYSVPVYQTVYAHWTLKNGLYSYSSNNTVTGWRDSYYSLTGSSYRSQTSSRTRNYDNGYILRNIASNIYIMHYTTASKITYRIGTYSDWFSWGNKKSFVYGTVGSTYTKNSYPSTSGSTTVGNLTYSKAPLSSSINTIFGGAASNNSPSSARYYPDNMSNEPQGRNALGNLSYWTTNGSSTLGSSADNVIYIYNDYGTGTPPNSFTNWYNNDGTPNYGTRFLLSYNASTAYYYTVTSVVY